MTPAVPNTQQLANAAETFVKVLGERFPDNTFDQLFHGDSLHQAYWKALQRTLEKYASSNNSPWGRGLMTSDVLAQPRVVGEMLKLFVPDELPDYGVVAEAWSTALGAGIQARALLGREAEMLFTMLADELRQSPDVRVVLHQLGQGRTRTLSGLFDRLSTQEADLARLLDAALVSGPPTLSLQVRHLLGLGETHSTSSTPVDEVIGLDALVSTAGYVDSSALMAAWRQVDAVSEPERRLWLLVQLAPHLGRAGLTDDPLALVLDALDHSDPVLDSALVVEILLDLAPHLAAAGAESGLPSFQERLLDAACTISDPASRLRALTALIQNMPAPLQDRAVNLALEVTTCCISGDVARADALSALAPYLSPDGLLRLVETANDLPSPDARALLFGRMIPHLSSEMQPLALVGALEAIEQITGDDTRTQALIELAPHIDAMEPLRNSPDGMHGVLSTTFSITRLDDRARAFAALAPYLSPELLSEALHIVKGISSEYDRTSTLVQLAPHLPDDLLVSAFVTAQELSLPDRRAAALAVIGPYLQPPARQQALGLALAAALSVEERYPRVEVLVDLAPHLPDELKNRAMQDALTATRSIPNEYERARALVFLAPHLLPHQLADAVADAYTIIDPLELVSALSALMPYLPPEPLARVGLDMIRRARALGDVQHKAGILASLAPVLPDSLVGEAVQAALLIDTPYEQIHVLTALLPSDPDLVCDAALSAARAVPDAFERVNALLELNPYLPLAQRQSILNEALEAALRISDDYDRASALAGFGPYVSGTSELHNRQQDALSLALDACLEIPDRARRTALLARLARVWAEVLPAAQAYVMWRRVIEFLRSRAIDEVITGLMTLAPLIEAMGVTGPIDEIAGALLERVLKVNNSPSAPD